jgi:hypothetical protein
VDAPGTISAAVNAAKANPARIVDVRTIRH